MISRIFPAGLTMKYKGHYHSLWGDVPAGDLPVEATGAFIADPLSAGQRDRAPAAPGFVTAIVIPDVLPRAASGRLHGSWTALERFYISIVPD